MNTPSNLPVHAGGSLLHYSTPEEYATAIKAIHALMTLVEKHNEGNRYVREANNENDDQFLYGQNFDTEPEIWDHEDYGYYSNGLQYL
tara:strand:- start:274 stop:537 length:264 start_codon:yes stop_codon:yes gene_type:complete